MKKIFILMGLMFMLSLFSANASVNDPVAYYSFDGGSLADSVGINNLTNTGAVSITGKLGDGFRIEGTDNLKKNPSSNIIPAGDSAHTINYWVNLQGDIGTTSEVGAFFGYSGTYTFTELGFRDVSGDKIENWVSGAEARVAFTPSSTWEMVTMVYHPTSSNVEYFRNGTSLGNSTITSNFNFGASGNMITIGNFEDTTGFPLNGDIDEVAYYDKELTQADINQLYNNGAGYKPFVVGNQVVLTYPLDNTLTSDTTLQLNYSINITTDNVTYDPNNCSLYINNVFNETDIITNTTEDRTFTKTFAEGSYDWNVTCEYDTGNVTSETFSFTIDSTSPNQTNNIGFVAKSENISYYKPTCDFCTSLTYYWNYSFNSFVNLTVDNTILDIPSSCNSGINIFQLKLITAAAGDTYSCYNYSSSSFTNIGVVSGFAPQFTSLGIDSVTFDNDFWVYYSDNVALKNSTINITGSGCNLGNITTLNSTNQNVSYSFDVSSCDLDAVLTNSISIYDTSGNTNTYSYTLNNRGRLNISMNDFIGGTVNNFTAYIDGVDVGSTTNGVLTIDNLPTTTNSNLSIDAEGYALTSTLFNITSTFTSIVFNVYTTNSINFTFRDELTKNIINNQTINVELIGDYFSYNYSTSNGSLYVDLIFPSSYTIRYDSAGYGDQRRYEFTMNNRSHTDLDLYLLQESVSNDLVVTVYDQLSLTTVSGAVVYLLRFDITTNSFITVATYETDVSGKAYFDAQFNTEYYKFIVDYPFGTTRLISDKLYIQAAALNLYISLEDTVSQAFYEEQSISYSISYNEANREFTVTYVDTDLVADEFCLYIKQDGRYSKTILNSSCTTASTGSISLSHPNATGVYYAVFDAEIDGDFKTIGVFWKDLDLDTLNSGVTGIFFTIVLMILLVFTAQISYLSMMFGSLALVFAKLLGIFTIGWPILIGMVILSIIITVILEMRK